MGLRRAAWRQGKAAGRVAWEWLREQPPVKRKLSEAERRIALHRAQIEERLKRFEAELLEWLRQVEASQGIPSQRGSSPSLSESYARLGVAYGAPLAEVRRAWRLKMRACHPDLSRDPMEKERAEREARLINEAFQVIKAALGA